MGSISLYLSDKVKTLCDRCRDALLGLFVGLFDENGQAYFP